MGKKSRRGEKKPKVLKTELERKEEMDLIKSKLTSLGLSPEMEGIAEFYEKAALFERSGESWSGKIKVTGQNRILDIIFTPNKHKDSLASLLYSKGV